MYGGISSILVFIIFITYLVIRLREFITLDNVKKDFHIQSHNYAKINFNTYGKFMIVTCLSSPYNFTKIDEYADSALEHKFKYNEVYRRPWLIERESYTPIKICKFKDFPTGFISPPLFKKYSKCHCLPHKNLRNFKIRNYWTEEYYSNLEYSVKFKDKVFNNKTKMDEYMKHFRLKNPRLVTFFIESDINIEALTDPMIHNFN